MSILLGFEAGNGRPVSIPSDRHIAITGQTQQSGKTTTLEALVHRSGLRAVAFVTKRGEKSFRVAEPIAPYFRERTDWQFVAAVLEAHVSEKLKFQRSWIMKLCEVHNARDGKWPAPRTLHDVLGNVEIALEKARGINESVYIELREYLKSVVPQIERLPYVPRLELRPGLNVMDLGAYCDSSALQSLVIRSVLEWVYQREKNVVVIVPEAWQFIPQGRSSPVRLAAEELIRKGATNRNYVWIDSQDIAGVDKLLLRSVGVWLFGVQREVRELKRTLDHIPELGRRPKPQEIATLSKGQFIVCFDTAMHKVYVQPAWMSSEVHAQAIARGEERVESAREVLREFVEIRKTVSPAVAVPTNQEADTTVSSEPVPRGVAADPLPPLTEIDPPTDADLSSSQRQYKFPDRDDEEAMWKEKYEDLQADYEKLRAAHDVLAKRVARLTERVPSPQAKAATPAGPNGSVDFETLYVYIRQRAMTDPGILQILTEHPELAVKVTRVTIQTDHSTLRGRLALMLSKKFFDQPRKGQAAYDELQRIGFKCAKPNVYRELDALAGLGFVVREEDGYQAVPGMKIRIVEQ